MTSRLRRTSITFSHDRAIDVLLLVVAYFAIAAAAYNGFYDKWQLRDDDPKFSFVAMIEGTAERPYVYRQLLPAIANAVEYTIPARFKESLVRSFYTQRGELKSGLRSPDAQDPK